MSAEEMGKLSYRIRLAFAVSSVVFLAALAISPTRDFFAQWKHYRRAYVQYVQTRPDTKRLLAGYSEEIDQIWLPQLGVVDRCTTCHLGITQPTLADAAVPQPFRAHPPIPHPVRDWGCTVCHRGQGAATEVAEAHETTLAWEQPILPIRYIQASCGNCHHEDLLETPRLNRGRALLTTLNCIGCHRLRDRERPEMLGPDLTNVGTKVSREWIYKWLRDPQTVTDSDGNTKVDGYETPGTPRMPKFKLDDVELRALSAYLSTQRAHPGSPYQYDPRVIAEWSKRPDLVDQGETRFRQMFCSTCHSLAVTRAGETKLIGGDIGPELTKVGSKVNAAWLAAWLRNPQAYLPHSQMARYQWSDEDLYTVTQYILTRLTDSDLLTDVPKLGVPTNDEIQLGLRLFTQKGCASCHVIEGVAPQKDFGPDLFALGGKNTSELEFSHSTIPRTLTAYIQAKLTDPTSVNPAARMPQYQLGTDDLDAITTALLGMAGVPATSGMQKLQVPRTEPEFHPVGSAGELYDRYKCSVCHKFNGYGGDLAPDLSFEGSRAQRQWIVDFLQHPQTLRPALILRMPQFNMSQKEAETLADYIGLVLQKADVNPQVVDAKRFTPQMANVGKQLYEVKYQCQSCHTIGSSGGYVGPSLTNAGNWMTPAWIQAWLKNPQALVPGAIEPKRSFTPEEIDELTSYLLTLRQSPKAASKTPGEQSLVAGK